MSTLEYKKAQKISLKSCFNEKWLQDRIEEDPSILGLGDIIIIDRERKQSSGGRIDFLFLDPEIQTMYETEIMLGATDESHIIRTIEYWDIESRRYPSRDHVAVIIAEEITNRFFNVISLMNRSIPIVAVQLNALRIDDTVLLDFTRVLDLYEPPEDIDELASETVDRNYWENRSNAKSISIMDDIMSIARKAYPELKVTYNKHHVAMGTQRRNFMWFHPRKREGYCHFDIRVGRDNLESAKSDLEEIGIPFTPRKEDILSVALQLQDFKQHGGKLSELINKALVSYS
jgi:hypothetical protein